MSVTAARGALLALALVLTLAACSEALPAKGTVKATVLNRAGERQAGCTVTRAVRGDNPYPFTEEAGATDRRGELSWAMYPGSYVLTVLCPRSRELRGVSDVVDVRSDQDTTLTITVL